MRSRARSNDGIPSCAAWLFVCAACWACEPAADAASPSQEHDTPLPIPARPAASWNCGERCWRDADLPSAAAAAFASTVEQVDLQPELIYPLAGSVHPINLAQMVFQFRRQSGSHEWFDIRLTPDEGSDADSYDFIVPCTPPRSDAPGDQCVYELPADNWREIAEDNAGRTFSVSVAASAEDDDIHRSASVALRFSQEPIAGGFYYWSTALGGTYRLPFGASQAVPWIAPGSASNPSVCGGCHAVSRDGSVIAFTSDAAAGFLQVADAADPTRKSFASDTERNSSMLSLNHDGSRVIGAYDGRLTLRDSDGGAILAEADREFFGGSKTAFFPEISADGREVVVTLSDAPDSFWSVVTGEIAIVPLIDDQFGEPVTIVSTPDEMHFYPSWSPDGQWIVFASAPQFSLSYDQPAARLQVVHREGGRVYELANATHGQGNTSTLPKFAPFVQSDGTMFFTFNSKADYGFLLENSAQAEPTLRLPQLWLASFDPGRIDVEDPSSAPLWLPFQQVDQRNHLGLWTERVSCGNDSQQVSVCGPGEVCIDSACRVLR